MGGVGPAASQLDASTAEGWMGVGRRGPKDFLGCWDTQL